MYKYLFFLFCFPAIVNAAPKGWSLALKEEGVSVYLAKSNPEVTGSFQINENASPLKWAKNDGELVFKHFEAAKRKSLFLTGIKDWKVEKREWLERDDGYELKVRGSYRDNSGQGIAFFELHFYQKNKVIQILHTRPAKVENGRKMESEIMSFMKREVGLD